MKKVIMVPSKDSGDYHLALLEGSLIIEGIKIIFPNKKPSYFSLPILKEALKSKAKILHVHWISSYAGFNTKYKLKFLIKTLLFFIDIYFAKLIFRLKIIWTIHNLYSHELFYPKLEKKVRKLFLKKSDAVIVHCNQAKKVVTKEFNAPSAKIYVIPQGNYINCYKNQISKEEARRIINLKEDDLVFLHFGRIRPHKGAEKLIEDFIKLENRENVKLLIVGRPLNAMTKKRLLLYGKECDNIKFKFEFIHNDEVQVYMNASDIIVTPYKRILNSGEIILAMGFGKPIIAPSMGCIVDVLNEKGSFLYNPKEKNGLKKALEEALKSKDKLVHMGDYNLNLIKSLEWKKIGKETKKVYIRFLK